MTQIKTDTDAYPAHFSPPGLDPVINLRICLNAQGNSPQPAVEGVRDRGFFPPKCVFMSNFVTKFRENFHKNFHFCEKNFSRNIRVRKFSQN